MGIARPYLRLVPANSSMPCLLAPLAEAYAHAFELTAAKPVAMALRKGALSQLLQSMTEEESIEFVHERIKPGQTMTAGAAGYRFSVIARSKLLDHESLASRVQTTLKVANDILSFCPVSATPRPHPMLTHAWQVRLNAIRATRLPAHGATTTFDPYKYADQFELPCPIELPAWALSSILNEDLGLPEYVRASIRVFPRALKQAAAQTLAHLRHRIQSGEFSLYDADSPITNYSTNKEISGPAFALIDHWLRSPTGYSVDLLIEASGPISGIALGRLTLDFAGNVPVKMNTIPVQDTCAAIPPVSSAHWLHHSQPLPGMFPDPRLLSALGVPRLFDSPVNLPSADSGVVVGQTVCGAESGPVHLPDADRTSHLAVLGSSGSGKSTLLLQLIAQDMAATDGRGVGLIDPHGTLYHDVLELVPRHRRNDVICVDVDDAENVASINPLEGTKLNPQKSSFVANEILSLIDVLFEGQDTSGPVGRGHLRNALQLVAWIPDREGTFLETLRIFEDSDFMDYLLSKCKNRTVLAHFKKFKGSSGDHGFSNWLPFLIPRLSPFCSSPITRRMLNRPKSTVNIVQAVAQGKILLFNLNTTALGSVEARIFGNLMMNQIFFAAMACGPIQGTSRKPFHLVVDEAASMVSENMLPVWSQARKFGLSLTTANQSVGQLRNRAGASTIADGILANTASKLMFRLGSDTERLQPYFRSAFTDTDMVVLPVFHAVANIVNHGQPIPPFVMRVTRPTRNELVHATAQECIDASNRANALPMTDVVSELCKTFDLEAADVGVVLPLTKPIPASTIVPAASFSASKADAPIGQRFYHAMSNAMHSTPGMQYPDDMMQIMNGAYVAIDAAELPSFESVGSAIKQDATVKASTKARLQIALSEIRYQLWPRKEAAEPGGNSSVSNRTRLTATTP